MNEVDQDRDDLPSSSATARLMKCAESHRMTIAARGAGQEAGQHGKDEYREHGNVMHKAIFEQSAKILQDDQARMDYAKIMRRFREFLEPWGAQDDDVIIREERMWLHDEVLPIFSGRPDYIRISPNGKRAAVVEFKSLWSKEDEPRENDQLWSQAVLLSYAEPEIEQYTLMIVSPHYSYVPYLATRDEVRAYEIRLRGMIERTKEKTIPVTGDWCRHCGGIMICPKIKEEAAIKSRHPSELAIEDLPKLLRRMERMEKYIGEVREYAKLMISKDPDSVPGWRLLEKQMRFLRDPAKVREAVLPVIGDRAFWDATTVWITKLEKAWETKRNAYLIDDPDKPQDAASVLAPFVTVRTTEASLVKDKKNGR